MRIYLFTTRPLLRLDRRHSLQRRVVPGQIDAQMCGGERLFCRYDMKFVATRSYITCIFKAGPSRAGQVQVFRPEDGQHLQPGRQPPLGEGQVRTLPLDLPDSGDRIPLPVHPDSPRNKRKSDPLLSKYEVCLRDPIDCLG